MAVDLKKCTYTELVAFTNEELDARLRDLKDDLLTQNVGLATNQANDFGRRRNIKHAIARCLMIRRKRELEQLPTPAALVTKPVQPAKPKEEKEKRGKKK